MSLFLTHTKIAISLWKKSKNGTIYVAVARCKVISSLFIVVALLGVGLCWGPTFWMELLMNFYGVRSKNNSVFRIWYYLAQISSSCLNPAVYGIFSPEFKNLVFKFCCCCGTHVFFIVVVAIVMQIRSNRPCEFTKRVTNYIRPRPHYSGGIWKCIKCIQTTLQTTPEEFKNVSITGHFGFVFEENSVRQITWLSWRHWFRRVTCLKCFPSTLKRKTGVFKFLWFEESFRKSSFSWRISVDGRPNRRNKAAFSWRISVDGRPNRRNKAVFSWRISVDGRPNRRNKAAFSYFSGVLWTPSQSAEKYVLRLSLNSLLISGRLLELVCFVLRSLQLLSLY